MPERAGQSEGKTASVVFAIISVTYKLYVISEIDNFICAFSNFGNRVVSKRHCLLLCVKIDESKRTCPPPPPPPTPTPFISVWWWGCVVELTLIF